MYPSDLKYSREHEWVRISGSRGHIGITHFAQEQLGDVVYVQLPDVGRTLAQGDVFGAVESVKAASDLFSPMSGTVVEVNPALANQPEAVNADPHATWMIVLELSNPGEADALLSAEQYGDLIKT